MTPQERVAIDLERSNPRRKRDDAMIITRVRCGGITDAALALAVDSERWRGCDDHEAAAESMRRGVVRLGIQASAIAEAVDMFAKPGEYAPLKPGDIRATYTGDSRDHEMARRLQHLGLTDIAERFEELAFDVEPIRDRGAA